jgi:hypothetical protein
VMITELEAKLANIMDEELWSGDSSHQLFVPLH